MNQSLAAPGGLSRRRLLQAGGAAALCAIPAGWAQSPGSGRLLINEAVTADLSISMLALRYKAWAEASSSSKVRYRETD